MISVADRAVIERCRQARRNTHWALLEGLHGLKHALRFDAQIEAAWTDDHETLRSLATTLAPDIVDTLGRLVEPISTQAFAELSPRPIETGVLAIAARPRIDESHLAALLEKAPAIWLEDPSHLGNIGAVIRVAAAAGVAAVFVSGHHDPWSPAALRGSAGLHFALPVLHQLEPPRSAGPLIAIDPDGDAFRPEDLPTNALLAFGSERRGLSASLLDRADQRLCLPMSPKVSSLNLATAVAAVLYAWRFAHDRQTPHASPVT
ncbi:MAG: TrmH family RNA methyltransferase [Pseudomonadota bacterium]